MNFALLLLIFILVLICAILVVKLYLIKHSIKEIKNGFTDVLESDTNNIITISSSDKDIKSLTITLNNNLIELRNQKLKYENGNQELKKIITNISHDLRTPLTAINGYIDLLKEEDISKTQEKYLKIIQKKSNELKELTEQLFEFSKTMDVDINIKKENCCINEILEETLISYYNIFKEKNIIPTVLICNEKIYKAINKNSPIRIFENILSKHPPALPTRGLAARLGGRGLRHPADARHRCSRLHRHHRRESDENHAPVPRAVRITAAAWHGCAYNRLHDSRAAGCRLRGRE